MQEVFENANEEENEEDQDGNVFFMGQGQQAEAMMNAIGQNPNLGWEVIEEVLWSEQDEEIESHLEPHLPSL